MKSSKTPRFVSPIFMAFVALMTTTAFGGTVEVPLWPGVAPGSEGIGEKEIVVDRAKKHATADRSISCVHRPTMTVHLPHRKGLSPAIVICPGGGLTRIVIDKEGNDFAKMLAARGVMGIVVKFRTAKSPAHHYGHAAPVADVKRAIRLARANARKWNIDPQRVGVFGFSAGGYLATSVATRFDSGDPKSKDPVARQSCRPDFLGLAYPLVSLQQEVSGTKYAELLLKGNLTAKRLRKYSNEFHVTADTPPVFVCHAKDDKGVSVENSLRFAAACRKADVACETFMRDRGGHGYGIRKLGTPINKWPEAFFRWLDTRNITKAKR